MVPTLKSFGLQQGILRALDDESPKPEGSIGVHWGTLCSLDGGKVMGVKGIDFWRVWGGVGVKGVQFWVLCGGVN